ncbi:GyrI-like domain-containing protein [Agromyces indicus]|uniref:GyrI-like domain-containing protein n=1 Tax=Agromyces indicus TaxID=758919 RepID=A0ABU1FHW6_9MICO|nr:GyrI-like domain-containing protein [Agromyces indicus]MDR5691347.1 GyrI-like domain-containing protein [Agromyces indicus]
MAGAGDKYDLKREHAELYAPSARDFSFVDVPPLRFLAVDGHGDPNSAAAYREAVEALFGVAYATKFASKRRLARDFVVAPLEGLWWAEDPTAFTARDKAAWSWTMLIAQPDWIDDDAVAAAIEVARAKTPNPALDRLRLERRHEGRSVQILHVGSYDEEAPTLARLHDEWMPQHGLTFNGAHHEIYLSDARRTAPDKLRTVLRQPVKPA